ncbi:conserved hypothetical protein [Ferrimonas balearica DSM 9799]|uniref:7-carboxy-7-deazaguanine synthase n=1 Tax=Ferrimonas balearica (strain DSM 9799 / CCM 4581 / KCTC 23876 / PAT) TaxID=550540 RepID=E1SVZ5_FERBD|nr:7-carboxy-7-deazaguanine synthase QueE [Ferrimonas balearica]ADN77446.1 conserved hypothetical protein [Ferrimonas balearica DSM 9799]
MNNASYPVNELFETIQGEGVHTGVPAIFLRLQGCPVGCSWCDTKHTWDLQENRKVMLSDVLVKTEESVMWCSVGPREILDLCMSRYTATHLVITGGEPCMYDLQPLCEVFEAEGYSIQVETSGTYPVMVSDSAWVTVSPKIKMRGGLSVLASAIDRADEIKHPVATVKDIEQLDELLTGSAGADAKVALQPISQKPKATELAIRTCIKRNWRLSVQTHKYLGIE